MCDIFLNPTINQPTQRPSVTSQDTIRRQINRVLDVYDSYK